jgi:hypothetical protein
VRSSVRVLISPRRSYLFVPCGSTGDEADCEVGFVSGRIPRRDFTDEHDGEVGLAAELVNASGILWHYGVKNLLAVSWGFREFVTVGGGTSVKDGPGAIALSRAWD